MASMIPTQIKEIIDRRAKLAGDLAEAKRRLKTLEGQERKLNDELKAAWEDEHARRNQSVIAAQAQQSAPEFATV
jgi:chromosome segregation ATPase